MDRSLPPPIMLTGTVHEATGGVYRVVLDDGREVEASLRGRLKRQERRGDRVVVGDRVSVVEADDGSVTVEEVAPRSSEIVRRGASARRPKVVAANVDRLVVVVAGASPAPRSEVVDRLLVIAESNGVDAAVVVNKVDLPGAPEVAASYRERYRRAGYPILATSAASGDGIGDLRSLLCEGTSVLAGPSGVGKSTLLNRIEPGLGLRTGELSRKTSRGRHTTVSARLLPLGCGGIVADTPGFSDVGVSGLDPEVLVSCFPELEPYPELCRFGDCRHLEEPDCAVRAAVESGEVPAERYRSYRELLAEAEAEARPGG